MLISSSIMVSGTRASDRSTLRSGGGTLNNACRYDRDVFCNQLRIEAIVLGEDAAGTGELTKFARIDPSDGQASCVVRYGRDQKATSGNVIQSHHRRASASK
jgi:hypothetical protein